MKGIQMGWIVLALIIMILLVAVFLPLWINGQQYHRIPQDTLDGGSPGLIAEPSPFTIDPPQTDVPETPTPFNIEAYLNPATPTPIQQQNCTHSAFYWVDHLDDWPDHFLRGNLEYYKDEAIKIYQTPSVDAFVRLFIQFNTTYLNILYGADPSEIQENYLEASSWLDQGSFGEPLLEPVRGRAIWLAKALENFNNGITGPGECLEDASSEIYPSSNLFVPAFTITPSTSTPTPTSTLTPIPTQTSTATKRVWTPIPPTKTPKPTRRAPRPATPAPTKSPPTAAPTVPQPPTREPPPTAPPPPPP